MHVRLLVVSPGYERAWELARWLGPAVEVSSARPGPELVRAVRERRPHLVILDAIDTRPGTAALEVALVKDSSPGSDIIALSHESTELDGDVIEQGVLCYLAGSSMNELVRVLEKAVAERSAAETATVSDIQPRSHS